MAYPKRVMAANNDNKAKAIASHAAFVSYVVGKVNKVGLEVVLQQHSTAMGRTTEFYWLKKALDRVLEFAEAVQLKNIAEQHNVDQKITVVFEKDNSENRIQAPRFAAPSLQ